MILVELFFYQFCPVQHKLARQSFRMLNSTSIFIWVVLEGLITPPGLIVYWAVGACARLKLC